MDKEIHMSDRFRGFLPIVVDVETGGFNCKTDALLEIAIVIVGFDDSGELVRRETHRHHVKAFEGANLEAASLAVNGIDPDHPLRPAIDERDALGRLFREIRRALKENNCSRAILVGHNAHFDLGFVNEAIARAGIKRNPFHPFSCFDTATLCGLAFGQTVLARAAKAAGFPFDEDAAHSAAYDAEITADVFCEIVNRFRDVFEAGLPQERCCRSCACDAIALQAALLQQRSYNYDSSRFFSSPEWYISITMSQPPTSSPLT